VAVLASMRATLLDRIRTAVGAWEIAPPVHVSLFDSAARSDGGTYAVGGNKLRAAGRQAQAVVDFADAIVRR
jgi:hypothetical protein